jgi:hypothetical protein
MWRTVIVALAATLVSGAAARADAVVSNCANSAELANAVQGGGTVTFNCGDNATLTVSASIAVERNVVIDGGLKVTLQEGNGPLFLAQTPNASLELRNLKFTGTKSTVVDTRTGATTNVAITITGSTFDGCAAPLGSTQGTLTISKSVFTNNSGNVVTAAGDLTIERSTFRGNKGIAVFSFGADTVTKITDSVFADNSNGALLIGTGSASNAATTLQMVRGEFSGNGRTPTGTGNAFGGVMLLCNNSATSCSADISGVKFTGNQATSGGALVLSGPTQVSLRNVRFTSNRATEEGGAVSFVGKGKQASRLTLQHAVFRDNRAFNGGGLSISSASLDAQTVTFASNVASGTGGGLVATDTALRLSRGILVENAAGANGGAITLLGGSAVFANALIVKTRTGAGAAFFGPNTQFINSTIADNIGAGIQLNSQPPRFCGGGVCEGWDLPIRLTNTILLRNGGLGNCEVDDTAKVVGSAVQSRLVDGSHNVEFPERSCLAQSTVADPALDTLYLPVIGGAATAKGDNKTCLDDPVSGVDVYGKRRPQGPQCSIGATEGDLEKEVADQTVGGRKWPGGLDTGDTSAAAGAGSRRPSRRDCCGWFGWRWR